MRTVMTLCFLTAVTACNDGVPDSMPVRAPELRNVAPSLESITVGEVSSAPEGYLAMAHVQPHSSDPSECQHSDSIGLRVDPALATDVKISSLCGDEIGTEVVLRACRDGERSIGDRGVASATSVTPQANGDGCFWCTSDGCLNNGALKQRKEGTIHPCFPDVWNSCCYAINGGCCS